MSSVSLGPGSDHKKKTIALVAAMIAVMSFSLVNFFTDVFNKDSPQATIQVNSIDSPEDVQYEIYLNRTGEMIAQGILPSNESVIHHFKGFASEQIVFWHSGGVLATSGPLSRPWVPNSYMTQYGREG